MKQWLNGSLKPTVKPFRCAFKACGTAAVGGPHLKKKKNKIKIIKKSLGFVKKTSPGRAVPSPPPTPRAGAPWLSPGRKGWARRPGRRKGRGPGDRTGRGLRVLAGPRQRVGACPDTSEKTREVPGALHTTLLAISRAGALFEGVESDRERTAPVVQGSAGRQRVSPAVHDLPIAFCTFIRSRSVFFLLHSGST